MADGELLIYAAGFCCTESHHSFPRCVSAGLGDFIFESVKSWHGWVVREERNPTSMMLGTSTAWRSLLLLSHDDLSQRPHIALCNSAWTWQAGHGNFWDPWWEGQPLQMWVTNVKFWCLCQGSRTATIWGWAAAMSAGAGCKTQPWVSKVSPQADCSGFSPCPWKQAHACTHCWIGASAPGLLSYKGCFTVWAAGAPCMELVLRCLPVNWITNPNPDPTFSCLLSAAVNPLEIIWQQQSEWINLGFADCRTFFLRQLSAEFVDFGD